MTLPPYDNGRRHDDKRLRRLRLQCHHLSFRPLILASPLLFSSLFSSLSRRALPLSRSRFPSRVSTLPVAFKLT